ncbi:hypothetical protein SAJA_13305 [Salinisphaera japonica YTM-1]|uniref:Uncharacterized protein n=1 Tax=Salinisphaera japonica YTM-1 TaxID=1209778 RepID=A0A423PI58_9GAMM|nr:hypothetical protein SAJA_13305 [Salinisphaera japonica YTM-1]
MDYATWAMCFKHAVERRGISDIEMFERIAWAFRDVFECF